MKNISARQFLKVKEYAVFILASSLWIVSFVIVGSLVKEDLGSSFRSVELGIAKLSPNGETGGYAVPASGGSAQSCTFDLVPNPAKPGQAVTANWTSVFLNDHALGPSNPPNPLVLLNAAAQGPDYDNDNSRPSEHPIRTAKIWRCNTGTNCIRGEGEGWTELVNQPIPFGSASGSFSLGTAPTTEKQYIYDLRIYYQNASWLNPSSEAFCTDSLKVENSDDSQEGAAVNLEVAKSDSTNWRSSVSITADEQVKLRWSSTNASSCIALSPAHNFVANATSGEDPDVDEPPIGQTYQYRVACNNSAGSQIGTDSVTVNAFAMGSNNVFPPTVDATDLYVSRGQNTSIIWNTNGNDPAACKLNGPGLSLNPVTSTTGSRHVPINSESMYTIQCPGGEDRVSVHVLPVIQET